EYCCFYCHLAAEFRSTTSFCIVVPPPLPLQPTSLSTDDVILEEVKNDYMLQHNREGMPLPLLLLPRCRASSVTSALHF
ncbi:hypothetical protein PIB30_082716, partial [Stylosanthes scabra]|nr:hypothetical protein [Stylosanthes scabra]